jgi:hypothetical protein
VNRESWIARTSDYGATWTPLLQLGGYNDYPWGIPYAIAAFDRDAIALAGGLSNNPPTSDPGVWWSNDAGATLHRLSASDIAGWPGGSGGVLCTEVKRLTDDAAILAWEVQNGQGPASCWAISMDRGHTYSVAVSQAANAAQYQIPTGKIVVTRDGAALMMLWQSDDYDTARLTIWRAPIICDPT